MVLADTSVWVAHFRHGEPWLAHLLSTGVLLMHPWIAGELACGNLKNRSELLADLQALPSARLASDAEAFALVEAHRLWGRGLGWIDVHLLVSGLLSTCPVWTLDKGLEAAARDLGLAWKPGKSF